jgi:hypothetical protein
VRENMAEATDPLDLIWIVTAQRLGLQVRRRADAFASSDGHGTLWIGTPDTLDDDDCVAQMVFHEICHWIVGGEPTRHAVDWGFEPMEDLHWLEYPTLRLQFELAGRYGLRDLLAPTTEGRRYWDALTDAVVLQPGEGPEILDRTKEALERSRAAPWHDPLDLVLSATAQLRRIVLPYAVETIWR